MSLFAVIDTETTWKDEVMSIGVAVADSESFLSVDTRYYILTPFKNHGGMYTNALYAGGINADSECSREDAMNDLIRFLNSYNVSSMFAYNAVFDYQHLPELHYLDWYDIMKIAAYKQYNTKIPKNAECYGTGRLKRGYGVESIYRILSENSGYCELHNALTDAVDELKIMKLLNIDIGRYHLAKIN